MSSHYWFKLISNEFVDRNDRIGLFQNDPEPINFLTFNGDYDWTFLDTENFFPEISIGITLSGEHF